jgi:hypothetical protein
MTLETGFVWQPTNTPWTITQYRAAAEHVAAQDGAVLIGEPTIVYPDQFDATVPDDMRTGVPLLRWTTGKQEN